MAQNYGLGRGLSSLIPQKSKKITEPQIGVNYFQGAVNRGSQVLAEEVMEKSGVQEIDIAKIIPNPHQPRLRFDEEKLKELATSIREHGIIQPIVVTKNEKGFEIIAGERRFQAAKLAGLLKVPVVVREATEQQKLELAIIENIQRHDLDPIEEAKSYVKLAQEFGLNQEAVAQKVGKSRSAVANKERLLKLPVEIQKALVEQKITEGHAKAILALENPEKQRALFEMIIKNNWTVRQVEGKTKEISVKTHQRVVNVDPEIKRIEEMLAGVFGTKVKVSRAGSGGKILIDYYSKEELDNILSRISVK